MAIKQYFHLHHQRKARMNLGLSCRSFYFSRVLIRGSFREFTIVKMATGRLGPRCSCANHTAVVKSSLSKAKINGYLTGPAVE